MKIALLAAAGSLALVASAQAQENQGYYGALGAGVAIGSDDHDLESDGGTRAAEFDSALDLDTNVAVYGAIGRYFQNGVRAELELANRSQQVDAIAGDGLGFAGFPNRTPLGDVSTTTLMVNVLKDFNLDASGRVSPYVGFGLGAARVRGDYNNISDGIFAATVADMAVSNVISVQNTDFVPAVQGLAGLTFDFTDNMLFSLGYRYLLTAEYDHDAYVNGPATSLSGEIESHEVTAGLRWNFGAPMAIAPVAAPITMKTCFDGSRIPVAQQCPPQMAVATMDDVDPLVVYFDYNKASLSSASERLIDAKVEEVMEGDVTMVSVSGNTDTVGSSSYNQALSARRAAVVREALVARGIDSSVITVEALGESNPARATGDGVKEPLNRRTEVDFSF